jgi:hypothetical protein
MESGPSRESPDELAEALVDEKSHAIKIDPARASQASRAIFRADKSPAWKDSCDLLRVPAMSFLSIEADDSPLYDALYSRLLIGLLFRPLIGLRY